MNTAENPPLPVDPASSRVPEPNDVLRFLRRLVVCNPFYLASALALLYGLSRITQDPHILTTETRQLLFQFGALHAYGCLMVGTAVWLARKRIWYDSALLVVLENGLFLAPFLAISQAVLIDETLAISLAVAGGLAVIGRAWSVRRYYPQFNLPDRVRLVGLLVLLINVGLPLVYRTRVDTDWRVGNQVLWLGVLPVLALLPNIMKRTRHWEGTAAGQSWLPLLILGMWLVGTSVHAWSVAWVDKTPTPDGFLAPTLAAALWTCLWRRHDFSPRPAHGLQSLLMAGACALIYIPTPNPWTAITLAAINTLLFGIHSSRRVTAWLPLRIFAAIAAVVSLEYILQPILWPRIQQLAQTHGFRTLSILLMGGTLLGFLAMLRKPAATLAGSIITAAGLGFALDWGQPHVSLQAAALFGIIHSLRWSNAPRREVILGHGLFLGIWTLDSIAWGSNPAIAAAWAPCAISLCLLLGLKAAHHFYAIKVPLSFIWVAIANMGMTPGIWLWQVTPVSLLTMALSLLLFGAGTYVALRRHALKLTTVESGPVTSGR